MTKRLSQKKLISLLQELIKDSNKSDRQLAKILGVSQPTISRMRKTLVEERMIVGYSVIPNFYKMGYKIMAITFVKTKNTYSDQNKWDKMVEDVGNWMTKKNNVVYADTLRGMGMDGGMISFHKSFEEFDKFMSDHSLKLGKYLEDTKFVLFNLGKTKSIKPFHFKYLVNTQSS